MANDLALFKSGVPAYLKNVGLDDTTRALLGGGASGKRISIRGGVFRMIANGEEVAVNEDRAMNIVVVNAAPHVSRTYYEGVYKDGSNASPTCWSADGKTPANSCETPQARKCDECPQNVKGSGQEGAKACRYSRKLAVVLDGDVEGDIYSLTLPATSMFGKAEGGKLPFDAYVKYLASHNLPVTALVTEMRFDTKAPVPKLYFKPIRPLNEDEWETCRDKANSAEAIDAVMVSFSPSGDSSVPFETPKLESKQPKASPKAKPKADDADEDEDNTPAPVKVEKKTKPAVEEDKDLADLIDEWAE
jgi:hypothetical protein